MSEKENVNKLRDLNSIYLDDDQSDKYLTFYVDTEKYAIEIRLVLEIVGIQKIISVPELPDYMKGIISLRGKIIPVMDARARLKIEEISYNERTCVIIIDLNGISTGLIVDKVEEVINIPEEQIEYPQMMGQSSSKFVYGIGKINEDAILIVDAEKMLTNEQKNMLRDVMEESK
jgi:purine-binding chemotaxis protein CheW